MFNKLLAAVVLVSATLAGCASDPDRYDKPGFTTVRAGRTLWVFRADSPDIAVFKEHGMLPQSVTRIGAGPAGQVLKAPDMATIDDYLAAWDTGAPTPQAAAAPMPPPEAPTYAPPADASAYTPLPDSPAYTPPASSQRQSVPPEQHDGWYVTNPK